MESSGIKINVAIISDLHIGGGAKSKDFSVDNVSGAVIDNYLDQFKEFVVKENIKADYLVVPGDISNSADKEEFVLASSLIKQIAVSLGVEEKKILFCPGNHDVDWKTITALRALHHSESDVIRSKYLNFHSGGLVFSDNLTSADGRFDESPYLVSWEFEDVLVCSLNTAVFDESDKKPHHGEVKPAQLMQIDKILSDKSATKKLKIFIFHHHPKQYLDSTFPLADFSAMTNAEGLLDILSKYGFDFVVHGHKHIPRFTMQIQTVGHPLWILCAGSFSASLDNRYFEAVGNNFHLIEFHDRCSKTQYARGVVKSWTHYSGPGWMQSQAKGSVDSQHYFGAFLPLPQLQAELQLRLGSILEEKKFVEWKSFVSVNPELKYYTNESLRASLKAIQGELNATLHEIDNINLDQLVILKR
ncbi:serine/threonine protein phosphatase [Pseudomonas sp. 31-12]|uniref:metallophosphoesterase family protein n=1 Tax=Pseudomonas sp. 31-12 TaxID=2201356 RepID=UPI000D6B448A|nr:metallophosphoesterase [Pseudomonas sp. 31-12]AWM94141.1 serine/threonine protein phosphatase [Pseudomonas sp. 31-12]